MDLDRCHREFAANCGWKNGYTDKQRNNSGRYDHGLVLAKGG